jgi:hypothetical protein
VRAATPRAPPARCTLRTAAAGLPRRGLRHREGDATLAGPRAAFRARATPAVEVPMQIAPRFVHALALLLLLAFGAGEVVG